MKVSKKAAAFMLLIVLLSLLFFACTKKAQLTALASGPTITVVTSSASSTSATITWTTNTAATSKVYYGTSTSFLSSTTEADTGANMTRNHSVSITGLTPSTQYYYYVASKDAANNTSTIGNDGTYTFTTTAAGPAISGVSANPSSTSCAVTWTTSAGATSQVFYGTTTSFDTHTTETTTTTITSHNVSLTGLIANTKYYYYVRSKNAAGNISTYGNDGSLTFNTTSTPVVTTFNLYIDDITITGTGGTPVIFYDDAVTTASGIFTGGTNNFAYMGSAADGSAPDINSMDFAATDEKHGGTASWKINLNASTTGWNGEYALASGAFRSKWTGSEVAGDLSGPTGTVTLTAWAKVTGITSTRLIIGLGDDSAYASATNIESIGTIGSKASCKKASNATTINSTSWTQISVNLGSNPNLSAINGLFLWSMSMADVKP